MFVFLRSPKGGNPLRKEWLSEIRRKPNLIYEPEDAPKIVQDSWCLKIGYCKECASALHITESVAKFLFTLLWKKFKKP